MTQHVMNSFVFVCYFSVGQAEVPEGIRAVAAGHRGEWPSQQTTKWRSLATAHTLTAWLVVVFVFQEEYEDSSGNVVNKKTYEDLKRQGLL